MLVVGVGKKESKEVVLHGWVMFSFFFWVCLHVGKISDCMGLLQVSELKWMVVLDRSPAGLGLDGQEVVKGLRVLSIT